MFEVDSGTLCWMRRRHTLAHSKDQLGISGGKECLLELAQPEVFQRRIHELIEGLQGVEVIAK